MNKLEEIFIHFLLKFIFNFIVFQQKIVCVANLNNFPL